MPERDKVLINLPSDLLNEADKFALKVNCTLDELVRTAIKHYIKEFENDELTEQMINGYQEMSDINIQIAEEFIYSDNEVLKIYETESNNKSTPS